MAGVYTPVTTKKSVFFWEEHFQIVLIVTGNKQTLGTCILWGASLEFLKHPLAQRCFGSDGEAVVCKKQMDHRKPGCPVRPVRGCDIAGNPGCTGGVDSEFVFGATEVSHESSSASPNSLLASTCSSSALYRAEIFLWNLDKCGIFSSLQSMVSFSEKLSV